MADNERIQLDVNDLPYGQLAPSQADRISWYPGKRPQDIKAGDATWDRQFRSPVGLQGFEEDGPLVVSRVRVEKLGRNIICDQTIAVPVVTGSKTTVIDDPATWGVTGVSHTLTETATQDVNGTQERIAGYDGATGAVSV